MLFDPVLYLDLFVDGGRLSGWHFNASPNFFPDMVLYFIYMTILNHNFIASNFAFSAIQCIMIILLINALYRQSDQPSSLKSAATFNLLFLTFLIIPLISDRFHFTFHLLSISYHLGSFVLFLICLNLLLLYLRKRQNYILALLFITSTIGVFNDRLFISQYIFSVLPLALFMIRKYHRAPLLKPLLISILSLPAGLALFYLISKVDSIHILDAGEKFFNYDKIGSSMINLLNFIWSELVLVFPEVLILIAVITALVAAWKMIIKNIGTFFSSPGNEKITTHHYLILIIAIYIPVNLLVPVINGSFNGPSLVRYNIMAFVLGIFLLVLLIQTGEFGIGIKKISYSYFVPAFSILFILLASYQMLKPSFKKGLDSYFSYYPEIAEIIDQLKSEHDLKYGIGNYWYSKYPTMFSKQQVRIYSVFEHTLRPFYHGNNRNWYYNSGKGKYRDPVFNFTVTRKGADPGIFVNTFGQNIDTIYLEAHNQFIILKTPDFHFDPKTRNIHILRE